MRLEVFNESEDIEQIVRLKLVSNKDGSVTVMVVDEYGKRIFNGCLICFQSNGTLRRCEYVSAKFGFQRNENGQIKEVD